MLILPWRRNTSRGQEKTRWRGFDVWKTSNAVSYVSVVDSSSLAFHRRILFALQFSGTLYKWCTSAGQDTSFLHGRLLCPLRFINWLLQAPLPFIATLNIRSSAGQNSAHLNQNERKSLLESVLFSRDWVIDLYSQTDRLTKEFYKKGTIAWLSAIRWQNSSSFLLVLSKLFQWQVLKWSRWNDNRVLSRNLASWVSLFRDTSNN